MTTSDDLKTLEHMHDVYQKKVEQGDHMWQPFFSVLDHMTSHDHDLTYNDVFDLFTSIIVSILIAKIIGVLHIKWKHYKENMP